MIISWFGGLTQPRRQYLLTATSGHISHCLPLTNKESRVQIPSNLVLLTVFCFPTNICGPQYLATSGCIPCNPVRSCNTDSMYYMTIPLWYPYNGIIEDTMHYMYPCHVSGTRYSVSQPDTYPATSPHLTISPRTYKVVPTEYMMYQLLQDMLHWERVTYIWICYVTHTTAAIMYALSHSACIVHINTD